MVTTKVSRKIQKTVQEYQQRMSYWLVDQHVLKSHTQYRPFVIVCNIRTGSTMLSSLLSSHPNIICFFELFHRHLEAVPFSVPGYQRKADQPAIVNLRNTDPVEFLNTQIFKPHRPNIQAVGFKLLYPQGRKDNPWWNQSEFDRWWQNIGHEPKWDHAKTDLWQYLKENKEIAIIHLKRENLLRSKVSGLTAQATGNWGVGATGGFGRNPSDYHFELNFEECLKDFNAHRRMEDEADEYFKGHAKLNLTYEEIVTNPEGTSFRVQSFLGVPFQSLTTQTRKQASKPLKDVIQNYDQLKLQFSNTRWQYLFDD